MKTKIQPWSHLRKEALRALQYSPAETVPTAAHRKWIRRHAHTHAYLEMAVCLCGEHSYGIDGRLVSVRRGSVWIIPGGISHDSWYGPFHRPCLDLWIHFFPHGYTTLNFTQHDSTKGLVFIPLDPPTKHLNEEAKKVAGLIGREKAAHRHLTPATRFFVLYFAAYLIEALSDDTPPRARPEQARLMEQIKTYIGTHLSDDLRLRDLAKVAGYSPFHFHRLFLQAEGMTLRQYVEERRLRHARERIEEGMSITHAGMDAGFSSPSDFSRVFRRVVGLTPGQWLRERKSGEESKKSKTHRKK